MRELMARRGLKKASILESLLLKFSNWRGFFELHFLQMAIIGQLETTRKRLVILEESPRSKGYTYVEIPIIYDTFKVSQHTDCLGGSSPSVFGPSSLMIYFTLFISPFQIQNQRKFFFPPWMIITVILSHEGIPRRHRGSRNPQGFVVIISIYVSAVLFRSQIFLTDKDLYDDPLNPGSGSVAGYQSVQQHCLYSSQIGSVLPCFCLQTHAFPN